MEAKGAGEELYLAREGSKSSPVGWRLGERQRHAEAEIKLDCEQEREGSGREKTSSRPLEIFSPQN